MADIDETLRKAGWFEVGENAGVWRSPDEKDDPTGRKYTTFGAAAEQLRRKAAEPKKTSTARKK